jgi:mono/diheme cytochrome c family protein/rhodanese-related sulfurtransferase
MARLHAPRAGGLAVATLLASNLLAGCGGASARPSEGARADEGARLYHTYCALCHGEDLEGYAADEANALAHPSFLRTVSDEFLEAAIAEGHPGTAMAAYARSLGGPLGADEIRALVAFIRSHQREPSIDVASVAVHGDAEAGAPLFAAECAGCHGASGEGATALSLNSPIFQDSASDGQIRYAIAHGREGTPMPAFAPRLSPAQLDDLVAFVRTLRREGPPRPRASELAMRFEHLVQNPGGPTPRFTLRDGRFVPAAEVAAALEAGSRLVILDARAPSEWLAMHIPGSVPGPYYAVEDIVPNLPRDGTWIVAYCGCPHAASGRVVDALREAGFEHTAVLDEGIFYWRDEGYPLASGNP